MLAGELMGRGKSITIHLTGEDVDLKRLIGDLKKIRGLQNPYHNRSESEIARMMLDPVLRQEHKRICKPSAESEKT